MRSCASLFRGVAAPLGCVIPLLLLCTERTSIITRDGRKQNGSLLYTILPIQFSIDQLYQRQMYAVDRAKERQRVARRMEQTSV